MYRLRKVEKKDYEIVSKWECPSELEKCYGAPFQYTNPISTVKWTEYLENCGNSIKCAIIDKTDRILGLVSLVFIDYVNQSAIFQIVIGDKENQEKGIGTWATRQLLEHAFYKLNLNRVEVVVLNNNISAIRLIEKCGFLYEGTKRNACYRTGKCDDLLMYSMLKHQFESINAYNEIDRLTDIPFWSIGYINAKDELDKMISECFPKIFVWNNYEDFLEKIYSKGITLLAYNKECIGFCTFYANDIVKREMYITLIAVKSEYQGLHIGKGLLEASCDEGKRRGMESCILEVKKDNVSAIRFYKKNGFHDFKENENSYYLKKQLLQC